MDKIIKYCIFQLYVPTGGGGWVTARHRTPAAVTLLNLQQRSQSIDFVQFNIFKYIIFKYTKKYLNTLKNI